MKKAVVLAGVVSLCAVGACAEDIGNWNYATSTWNYGPEYGVTNAASGVRLILRCGTVNLNEGSYIKSGGRSVFPQTAGAAALSAKG
jgi:hypothetical protein